MRVRNVSDAILTISKQNIESSADAALLTRDATLRPGDELVIYDFIAGGLVSLSSLVNSGALVVVNDDQPENPPSIGIPGVIGGGGGGTPAGISGQVQFNDSGAFAASSNLYWDDSHNRLGVGINMPTGLMSVNSSTHGTGVPSFIVTNSQYGETIFDIQSRGRAVIRNYDNYNGAGPGLLVEQHGTNAGPGMWINHYGSTGAGLRVDSSANSLPAIQLIDNTQGAGKVLTSDASGFGSWQAPSAGSPAGSSDEVQYNSSGSFGGASGVSTPSGQYLYVTGGGANGSVPSITLSAEPAGTPTYGQIQSWDNVPLSINPDGNNVGIGIGSTAPTATLSVFGNTSLDSGAITTDGNGSTTFQTPANNGLVRIGASLQVVNTSSLDNNSITTDGSGNLSCGSVIPANGATGTFTTADSKTVTVTNGIITSIV